MLFIITYLFIYYYYYYNPALGRLYVMERRVLLGTRPNFSIHFLLILGPVSQNPHYNTTVLVVLTVVYHMHEKLLLIHRQFFMNKT